MKKQYSFIFALVAVLLVPLLSFASFDRDLYFGMRASADVTRLQDFLKAQSLFQEVSTGNFLSLTRAAVQAYQEREGISPAAGYFGPKTRGRVNALLGYTTALPAGSAEEQVAFLMQRIEELKRLLNQLTLGSGQETPLPDTNPPMPPPQPPPPEETAQPEPPTIEVPAPSVLPSPAPAATLNVSGTATGSFPDTVMNPLKLGDFTIVNNTANRISLSQIAVRVTDEMNSSVNRSREVFLTLRKGTTTADTQVSRTAFVFNSMVPPSDGHVYLVSLPYGESLEPGAKQEFGLWVESLELVISGKLSVTLDKLLTTDTVPTDGSFTLTLTK